MINSVNIATMLFVQSLNTCMHVILHYPLSLWGKCDEFQFFVAHVDKTFQSHWSDWINYIVGIKYYGVVVSDLIQCMNLNIHHVNWNIKVHIWLCGFFLSLLINNQNVLLTKLEW